MGWTCSTNVEIIVASRISVGPPYRHSVASRYTDCAIPATVTRGICAPNVMSVDQSVSAVRTVKAQVLVSLPRISRHVTEV